MSEYKLAPVERCAACGNEKPVSEMETCMHAQMHRYVCDLKCMIDFYNPPKNAAAPAVQGEPVGEVRLELGAQPYVFAELYSKSLPALAPGTKLYAAPQPAEHQPAPDVAGLEPFINKATGEKAVNKPKNRHRNLRSLMREESADFDPVPARQPAPDVKSLVKSLVEALESAKNLIANHSGEVLPDEYAGDQIEQIDAALAAHRKQGGE